MILDTQEVLSTAQAFTATGDTVSTNVIDTGAAHDEGPGEEASLVVNCTQSVTSAGAPTVQFVLQTSPDNSAWADLAMSNAFLKAALLINTTVWVMRLPVGMKRYYRLVYRVAVTTLTAGAFSAFVVKDPQVQQYLPIGYAVG